MAERDDNESAVWVCVEADYVGGSVRGTCARCRAPIFWSLSAPPAMEKICLRCAEDNGPLSIVIPSAVVEEFARVSNLTIDAARLQMRALIRDRYRVDPMFTGIEEYD